MGFRIKCWRPFRRVSDTIKFLRRHAGLRSLIKTFLKMLRRECSRDACTFNHNRPDDFTSCYWQKQPGVKLYWVMYRGALFAVLLVAFLVAVFWPQEGCFWYKHLLYFTYWSLMAEILAFALLFSITVKKFKALKKDPNLPPLEVMPVEYKIAWCFYTLTAPASLVVSIIFWCFIYKPDQTEHLFGITLVSHALNSLCIILDFCLNAIPYRFLQIYVLLLFSLVYGLFSVAYQLSGGTGHRNTIALYPALDWRNPGIALLFCGMQAVCDILMHSLYWVMNVLKYCMKKTETVPV